MFVVRLVSEISQRFPVFLSIDLNAVSIFFDIAMRLSLSVFNVFISEFALSSCNTFIRFWNLVVGNFYDWLTMKKIPVYAQVSKTWLVNVQRLVFKS